MTAPPERSVAAKAPKTPPFLEESADEALRDVRLSAEDRELVKWVIAQLERRLSVDALMFAAGGFEDAAIRARRAEELRRA